MEIILVFVLLLLYTCFWPPQWYFLCYAGIMGEPCLTQLTLVHCFVTAVLLEACTGPVTLQVLVHSDTGGCSGCWEEVTGFSHGNSAEQQVLCRKLLLCFRLVLFLSEGMKKKSLPHKCLCNRNYSACYTMNAIICIDLFAFHCEMFNVAA